MTNREFITKYFQDTAWRTAVNGNLIKDQYGTIYSYGYHYPLLFTYTNKKGLKTSFRNIQGYSMTTSKHIGLCYGLYNFDIKILDELTSCYDLFIPSFEILSDCLTKEIKELEIEITKIKKRGTKKQKILEEKYINRVKALNNL